MYDSEIHHRRSVRLKEYDYSSAGAYFVTICTSQQQPLFGEIYPLVGAGSKPALDTGHPLRPSDPKPTPAHNASEMKLNEFGKLVEFTWHDLPNHNQHVCLDSFIIMPNHIHGIVIIENNEVGFEAREGLEPAPTLSEIVRQFKTFSAKRINLLRGQVGVPVWQRNYYERVIRNQNELNDIRTYIENNPMQWEQDNNNTGNLL